MAVKSTRNRRPKRKPWSGDDFVDAVVEWVQLRNRIGRGNSIRLILGRPLVKGLINSEMVADVEVTELKAWLFDLLFRVYGDRIPSGLRLVAEQARRGQKGAAMRKKLGNAVAAEIVKHAQIILSKGNVAKRNIAGVVAKKIDKHPSYVRKVLKKARQTQG